MEMVDILTAAGENTGQVATRAEAHRRGLWHRTVHVWMINFRGELLLQKRASAKETHPELWDISAAGHVEAGASGSDAALREVREELGVALTPGEIRYLFTVPQQYADTNRGIIDNEITDVFLCSRPVADEEIVIDPVEVEAVGWFPVQRLKVTLVEEADRFVPHDEEYHLLFNELSG